MEVLWFHLSVSFFVPLHYLKYLIERRRCTVLVPFSLISLLTQIWKTAAIHYIQYNKRCLSCCCTGWCVQTSIILYHQGSSSHSQTSHSFCFHPGKLVHTGGKRVKLFPLLEWMNYLCIFLPEYVIYHWRYIMLKFSGAGRRFGIWRQHQDLHGTKTGVCII